MRCVVSLATLFTLATSTTLAQNPPTTTVTTPQLDFSGVVFGNFQWRTDSASKASTGGQPFDKFDIGRAYLTFGMPAGNSGSVRITTDIFQQSPSTYYSGWVVRLKYGWYQHEISRNLFGVKDLNALVRIGMLNTVMIHHLEAFWPRFIAVTADEQYNFYLSSDVGVGALMTLPSKRGNVYLTLMNGPGYTSGEIDRFKDYAASLQLTPFANDSGFVRTLAIIPYIYKGSLASAYVNPPFSVSSGIRHDRRGIFLGIRDRRLTGGYEFGQRLEQVETPPPGPRIVTGRTSNLSSGFAFIRPFEIANPAKRSPFGVFTRLDRFDLDIHAPASPAAPIQRLGIFGLFWGDLTSGRTLSIDYQEMKQVAPTTFPAKTLFMHWVAYF